jgi:hypothetical protein
MTLEEAIQHAREVASKCLLDNPRCSKDHEELSCFLEELIARRVDNMLAEVDGISEGRKFLVEIHDVSGDVEGGIALLVVTREALKELVAAAQKELFSTIEES